MAIKLDPDEIASLEQFVRPYKPTKRQKAQVLLALAAGESPEEVALRVGISKDMVAELAGRFAEHGLAGVGLKKNAEVVVTLIRAGVGDQKFRLPEGSTLDDLMSLSQASTARETATVEEVIPEKTLLLRNGAVVIIAPAPTDGARDERAQPSVPSLKDDDLFEQFRDILKARRKSRARKEGSAE